MCIPILTFIIHVNFVTAVVLFDKGVHSLAYFVNMSELKVAREKHEKAQHRCTNAGEDYDGHLCRQIAYNCSTLESSVFD